MKKLILLITLQIILDITAEASAIERRREQFLTQSSYLIFPLPYSLEGIGDGIVVTGRAQPAER